IARVNAHLQESLIGMTVIQLFGREATAAAEFARLNEDHRRAVFRRMGFDAVLYSSVEVIGSVAIAGVIWWGAGKCLAGSVSLGVLGACMGYITRFFLHPRDVSAKYAVMQSGMVAAERVFGPLDAPAEIVSPATAYQPPLNGNGDGRHGPV